MKNKFFKFSLIAVFLAAILLGISSLDVKIASAISSKKTTLSNKVSAPKSIPFKVVYSGFLVNNTTKVEQGVLPRKDIIFNTSKDWEAFKKNISHLALMFLMFLTIL